MKHMTLIFVLVAMIATLAGVTSAQDRRNRPQVRGGVIREVINAVSDETGLAVTEILAQLQADGATLADVIEANGGSVDSVVAATTATATERINQAVTDEKITQERADEILSNLEQWVTDGINGDLPLNDRIDPQQSIRRALMTATTEATGLDTQAIIQQLRDGKTLADVITENGATVDGVLASAMTIATDRVNEWVANERITQERADELLVNVEQVFSDILNGEFDRRGNREGRRAELGVLRQLAEQTGLSRQDLVAQLRDGTTPAEILTSNGIAVDTFVDGLLVNTVERLNTAVENGRLTQEQADERLATIRTTLTDRLNNPVNLPAQSGN